MTLRTLVGLVGVALIVSCGPPRYPLAVVRDHLALSVQDGRGQEVTFLLDTGAALTLANKRWAVHVGAEVVPIGAMSAPGINLTGDWNSVGYGLTVPGLPFDLQGVPLLEPEPGSLFGQLDQAGLRSAAIVGIDQLDGWSIDLRGDQPWLVHGSVASSGPHRLRFGLVKDELFWWVPCSLVPAGGGENFAAQAMIDTGNGLAATWFHPAGQPWAGEVANNHVEFQSNGLATGWFSTPNFQIGTFAPDVWLVSSVAWPLPGTELNLGTPFFLRHRAVLDLVDHSLTYDPKARAEEGGDWAWSADFEPGSGVTVQQVVEGSALARHGVTPGTLVTQIDGEPAGRARSILEWTRAWRAVSRGQVSP